MNAHLRKQLLAHHRGELRLSDRAIDRLLGIRDASIERKLRLVDLLRRSGPAAYEYQGTTYAIVRDLLRWCRPGPHDVFYDLGAGYGRVILYGAATSTARFRGIELVPERVAASERCRASLGLRNVSFHEGDARAADFRDGTIFFLFNPFLGDTLAHVGDRLRRIAARRAVRIASLADSNDYFASQSWLHEITPRVGTPRPFGLRLFAT